MKRNTTAVIRALKAFRNGSNSIDELIKRLEALLTKHGGKSVSPSPSNDKEDDSRRRRQ
jgi:hypothetical protein